VGPRAGLDTEAREKILCLCRGSNLDRAIDSINIINLFFVKFTLTPASLATYVCDWNVILVSECGGWF
jgi:hypothetical protein